MKIGRVVAAGTMALSAYGAYRKMRGERNGKSRGGRSRSGSRRGGVGSMFGSRH